MKTALLPLKYAPALLHDEGEHGMDEVDKKEIIDWFRMYKPGICIGVSPTHYYSAFNDMNDVPSEVAIYYFDEC